MTSAEDSNDLVTAQEKLEWVTPQISLMRADRTAGNKYGEKYPMASEVPTPNAQGVPSTVTPAGPS